jgi:hypothetical protein
MRSASTWLHLLRGTWRFALACALLTALGSGIAAPARANDLATGAEVFEAGVDEAVRELGKEPELRHLSPKQLRARAEFVFGNMLFVTTHELAHALVSEMDLLVLGREEDAADAFATLGALLCGTEFSRRMLVEAAKGWFMTAQRNRKDGDTPTYYDRHGLDQQRAYQIVCLMVGSNPERFKDLADETDLPADRRRSCTWDYDTASRSWDRALASHQRGDGQPKTRIEVVYGEGKGELALYASIFSAMRFLETIVEQVADRFAWPAPIVVEMRTCGEANARWTVPTRRLHICYELAQEFAELYRDFGKSRTLTQARQPAPRQRLDGLPNGPRSVGTWKQLRGSGTVRESRAID